MPSMLQAKLLRVLENDEVFRIGANEPIKVNVRVLSATHRDLEAEVKAGRFRQDLYHRLKVVSVTLPPLRERREDIPLLTAHFVRELSARHGKKVATVSDIVRKAFHDYSWPGNVRELRNTVESMVVLDRDGVLGPDDLEDGAILAAARTAPAVGTSGTDALIGRPLSEVERHYMEKALEHTGGKREEAAALLGIGERTLYRSIQEWKVQDQVRAALTQHGTIDAAAESLGMTGASLSKKIKKWGWT
jgi:two-component system response regulator HydG